jgi:hypothetical protein
VVFGQRKVGKPRTGFYTRVSHDTPTEVVKFRFFNHLDFGNLTAF